MVCGESGLHGNQFEWYRDNDIYRLRVFSGAVFFVESESILPHPAVSDAAWQTTDGVCADRKEKMEEKKMKKRIVAGILTMTMLFGMTGCGSGEKPQDSEKAAESYKIGIAQFAEHPSLDNCREGFLAGLAEEGIEEGKNLEIMYDNAQTDTGTASTIAENYVSKNVNMICAIATPCAMSAYNATMNTDIPVVYTAISDPVGAQLAGADGSSVGNVTGTSDALPVKEQLALMRKVLPDAKKVGIIYTTSEANSVSTIEEYKKYAKDFDFEIVETGINVVADVDMAAANMVEKVDCITNLTDNTVVSALQTVLEHANEAGIPVFGSEVEQVKAGCIAAAGIDYLALGKQTGKMAAKILKGEAKASDMPFEVISEPCLYVNTAAAEKISLSLTDEITKDAEIYDEIVVNAAEE